MNIQSVFTMYIPKSCDFDVLALKIVLCDEIEYQVPMNVMFSSLDVKLYKDGAFEGHMD